MSTPASQEPAPSAAPAGKPAPSQGAGASSQGGPSAAGAPALAYDVVRIKGSIPSTKHLWDVLALEWDKDGKSCKELKGQLSRAKAVIEGYHRTHALGDKAALDVLKSYTLFTKEGEHTGTTAAFWAPLQQAGVLLSVPGRTNETKPKEVRVRARFQRGTRAETRPPRPGRADLRDPAGVMCAHVAAAVGGALSEGREGDAGLRLLSLVHHAVRNDHHWFSRRASAPPCRPACSRSRTSNATE